LLKTAIKTLKEKLDKITPELNDIKIIHIDIKSCLNILSNSINLEDKSSLFNYDFNDGSIFDLTINDERITIKEPCLLGKNTVCSEPQRAIFWDHTHPSSYLHCLLAFHIHQDGANNSILNSPNFFDYLKICRPNLAQSH
jgi:phospholipase/lecithinase/hemolysin